MKPLLLFLLLAPFLVRVTHAQCTPARLPYTVAPTTAAAFQKLARPTAGGVVADKQGFTRKGDAFILQFANGRHKHLLSKPGRTHEDDIAELSYLGKLPRLHKYVLHVLFYEDSAILLVDQQTGAIDSLQDVPTLSPHAGFVAAAYQGYPYEEAPNGVEVFQVAAPRLRHKFTIAQEQWLPYGLAWVDERSFIVKCLPLSVEKLIESGKLSKKVLQGTSKFFYLRVTMR